MADAPRTYTGWKAGLAIVGGVLLVFSALNWLGDRGRSREPRFPRPVVTTVTPSPG